MARINYEKLSERVCEYCKKSYKPTGPSQKACPSCISHLSSITRQVYRDIARYKKFGTYETIGKGMAQGRGVYHHSYKNGIGSHFMKIRGEIKEEVRHCQHCGKDLRDAGRYHWCIHHIDHNRSNNARENLTLLCKRCHQIEHNCYKHLQESATTRVETRTPKQVEAVGSRDTDDIV